MFLNRKELFTVSKVCFPYQKCIFKQVRSEAIIYMFPDLARTGSGVGRAPPPEAINSGKDNLLISGSALLPQHELRPLEPLFPNLIFLVSLLLMFPRGPPFLE